MVSAAMSIVKYGLFLFNLIFVIIGVVLIACGGILLSNFTKNRLNEVVANIPKSSAVFLILVGVAVFLIAFLGCCGALRESYGMLLTFATVIFILFIVELVAAGFIYSFRTDLKENVKQGFKAAISNYNPNNTYAAIDDVQKNFECCGATNFTDWSDNFLFNNGTYPHSCCKSAPLESTCTEPFEKDCYDAIADTIKGVAYSLATSAVVVAVFQLMAILFAFCLARVIKREYDVV